MDVLSAVFDQHSVAERLDRLTTLIGVDVPVASAFLMFTFPDRYVAIGDREWRALVEADELERSYPDAPSVEDYRTYHEICRDLTDRFDADAWTLYRTLWRISDET